MRPAPTSDGGATAAWEARADRAPRATRPTRRHDSRRRMRARRDAEHARARAEASGSIAEERIARADRESTALVDRETSLAADRDRTPWRARHGHDTRARGPRGAGRAARRRCRGPLPPVRRRTGASTARDALRSADDRVRAADHAELEARLGLESLREGVLVELAGLGELGFASLGITRPEPPAAPESPVVADAPADDVGDPDAVGPEPDAGSDDTSALEAALAVVALRWASEAPPADPPSPGRLGAAPPPLSRARRGESVRRRGVRGAQDSPRVARDAGRRPASGDREDARAHRRARRR